MTVTKGTAHRVFRERGMGVPGTVGKTGMLADRAPFRDYSWFVGFAPKDDPKVVALIVNEPIWLIRATWLGRQAMRLGLARLPPGSVAPVKEETTPVKESPADEESSEKGALREGRRDARHHSGHQGGDDVALSRGGSLCPRDEVGDRGRIRMVVHSRRRRHHSPCLLGAAHD
ncbi:hypothetical protein [Archangium violaceum]|uniref:hypothetical protein n=1 Tax=Archangium violaceum TaxID=83451 RepID=UPI0037C1A609